MGDVLPYLSRLTHSGSIAFRRRGMARIVPSRVKRQQVELGPTTCDAAIYKDASDIP